MTVLAGTAAGALTAAGFPPVGMALLGVVAGMWAFRASVKPCRR